MTFFEYQREKWEEQCMTLISNHYIAQSYIRKLTIKAYMVYFIFSRNKKMKWNLCHKLQKQTNTWLLLVWNIHKCFRITSIFFFLFYYFRFPRDSTVMWAISSAKTFSFVSLCQPIEMNEIERGTEYLRIFSKSFSFHIFFYWFKEGETSWKNADNPLISLLLLFLFCLHFRSGSMRVFCDALILFFIIIMLGFLSPFTLVDCACAFML